MSHTLRTALRVCQYRRSSLRLPALRPKRFHSGQGRPSIAIGIDLGTTQSVVARLEGRTARVIPDANGHRTTPSVVAFATGEERADENNSEREEGGGVRLVGRAAVAQAALNPAFTFSATKRLIGRRFNEEEVAIARRQCTYAVVEAGTGEAWLGLPTGTIVSPVEVSLRGSRHPSLSYASLQTPASSLLRLAWAVQRDGMLLAFPHLSIAVFSRLLMCKASLSIRFADWKPCAQAYEGDSRGGRWRGDKRRRRDSARVLQRQPATGGPAMSAVLRQRAGLSASASSFQTPIFQPYRQQSTLAQWPA